MENYLKNLKCPQCKAQHLFMINVNCRVEVASTRIANPMEVKWDGESGIVCKGCYFQGTVDAFTVKKGRKNGASK